MQRVAQEWRRMWRRDAGGCFEDPRAVALLALLALLALALVGRVDYLAWTEGMA